MVTKQVMSEFSIANVITEKLIRLEMKAKTKKEAILELSELLKENGIIKDVDDFSSDVFQREKEGITGIGNGVAIPHGKSASVIQTSLVVGKVETPIPWESLDKQPVKVIILFAVKDTDANTVHIKLLQKVAMLLAEDTIIEKMNQATSKAELMELLAKEPTV
ncbi:PTS mannose transporter subunit IIAB [Enterococcus hirae 57-03-H11]|uniref:PTS sugar transporter subunit IIA n=1 Tax=Enterococcus TaxID=1350 RepID=UPI000B53EBF1|nr:PTS sugar transporter subunit IIA [Enterococcus hirae]OWW68679.1 PTS mannose transporter subunit IIAB [Enterococcus hirae 57-03-H11]EMF0181236.1 PTS sugar transporter subunit IIA [Enterococcus hirae]EMF0196280.1 PTS sugar transporter subunit IIA [Enterococcus hirae]EMF0204071.1 PTS sugar transporter subunit IIA [Enterococcus hirae]EMF0463087.1 PTS sugar transporter subunit IIA [Enterococcus hirae]